MGVSFYMSKDDKDIIEEEIFSRSYGGYHYTRTYLLACFNATLAKAFTLPMRMRTEAEKVLLNDISPFVPEGAWTLFSSSDSEGKWDNETLKEILKAVKSSFGFQHPEALRREVAAIASGEANRYELCGFGNIPEWRGDAVEFILGLERAVEKDCDIVWF